VPSPSSSFHPGWNSQGRIATDTPADKRRRLSQGLELRTNLQSEFATPPQQRGRRKQRKPSISLLFLLCLHLSCPQSYNQALKSPERDAWQESMAQELDTLQNKRKCWEVVPYPTDGHHNYLRCHFVYKVKMKQGKVARLKSRLVVDGSKQVHGLDYSESFALVVKYTTLRIFLAISASYNMRVHQLDVESAFIYASLAEVVLYPHPEMHIPPRHCIKLLRSLYGLKQSPRNWNVHLHDFIMSIGLRRSELDHCVYIGNIISTTVLIAVFVDDILIASDNDAALTHVKGLFSRKFRITDTGLAQEFLNIRITQEPNRIIIDQELYVRSLLDKYRSYIGSRNYADVPSLSEYMPRDDPPSTPQQRQFVESFPYPALVGALLCLAVVTRPDIMYAVGVLTHHLKCPTYASCKVACRVLNYLLHHPAIAICYSGSKFNLHAYTDSDWGSDRDTRRSFWCYHRDGWRPCELAIQVAAYCCGVVHGGEIHCLFLLCAGYRVDPSTVEGPWPGADLPHHCPDRQPLRPPARREPRPPPAVETYRHQVPLDPGHGLLADGSPHRCAHGGPARGLPHQGSARRVDIRNKE
jgi:hypothetical protein